MDKRILVAILAASCGGGETDTAWRLGQDVAGAAAAVDCSAAVPCGGSRVIGSEADLLVLRGCSSLDGTLEIQDINVSALAGLECIASIRGNLIIRDQTHLANLMGFERLTSVGGNLFIEGNAGLTSLQGLENLSSVAGDFGISGDNALTHLFGLESLTFVGGDLGIFSNRALTSLSALGHVTFVGGRLEIVRNAILPSLVGLENLTSVGGGLEIVGNASLPACEAEALAIRLNRDCACLGNHRTGGCFLDAGQVLADLPACTNAGLQSTLADVCGMGDGAMPVNPGTFADGASPRIDVGQAYGVRLKDFAGENEGVVAFTAPTTDAYVIYLGTPNVPFQVDTSAPVCSRYLSATRVEAITGKAACPKFRGVYLLPEIEAGTEVRIGLGPITPQRWVRLLVLPSGAGH